MKLNKETKYIFERVYIETPVDTDGDGKYDLIAAYIKRPESTLNGEKVPAVFVANPYLRTCNEDWYKPFDVNCEVKAYPTQNISKESITHDFSAEPTYEATTIRETKGFAETSIIEENVELDCMSDLYDHLLERGYASITSGGLGTRDSEGFTLTGSREEILAFKAVIDWLNGRCRAFTNRTDNIEIKADWCTGNVAMSAKSYLGTMCIGVAATGVEGLKTIIPEAGISNWYEYYRYNGLNVPALGWQGDDLDILAKYCFSRAKDEEEYAPIKDAYAKALDELVAGEDRDTGNYNLFWDSRNYLNQLDNFKASVFIIHGINDWNVKTNQCFPLFEGLQERGIDRKILLHQGEHVYVYDLENCEVLGMIDRWLDHYLKGIDNGVENEPKIIVESNIDQSKWSENNVWPPEGHVYEKFDVVSESHDFVVVDSLESTVYDYEKDNLKEWRDELVLSEDENYNNRVKFEWDPFKDEEMIRVAGTVNVKFDASLNQKTGILSCMLVDLGEANRITDEMKPVEGMDDGTFRFGVEEEPSKYKVISRGWLNAQNRSSIWSKEELIPGQKYSYEFDMVPTDHLVQKGHKLGLIIYGIDAEATQRPKTITEITVDCDSIDVTIPMVRM